MNWIEWASSSTLGTDGKLPSSDGASFHLGNYAEGSKGAIFPNPLKTLATPPSGNNWKDNGLEFAFRSLDPRMYPPGSIGPIKIFPNLAGDYKEYQTWELD